VSNSGYLLGMKREECLTDECFQRMPMANVFDDFNQGVGTNHYVINSSNQSLCDQTSGERKRSSNYKVGIMK
jgi:hypothetical protein